MEEGSREEKRGAAPSFGFPHTSHLWPRVLGLRQVVLEKYPSACLLTATSRPRHGHPAVGAGRASP